MINVVCAVILDSEGKMLVCQRSPEQRHSGKWEFPGGKVETGEDEPDALKREINEELLSEIEVGARLSVVEHSYPGFSVRLIPYLCRLKNGSRPQALEHAALRWVGVEDCESLDWAEADIPIWQELARGGR